jgi:DNA-binding GntR family transcriptional regulator
VDYLVPAKSLSDQVYEAILDALCDGTYKAGERVTQEEIADRLNVSRQPVTHALAVLKAQGFLTQSGRQGLAVAPIEPEFVHWIYQLRSAVEPLAVELAAPQLTASTIAQGRAIIERGRKMVAAGQMMAVQQADLDFHSFLYDLSGNGLIAETMRLHWRHLLRAMGHVLRTPGMSIQAWHEHERILETMIDGDTSVAAELMRTHLLTASERWRNR